MTHARPSEHVQLAERLFEHVGDMVCLLDAQGRFAWVNAAGVRMTGFSASELVGRLATDLIAPELRERAVRQFLDRLEDGIAHPPDTSVLVDRGGNRVPIEVTSVALSNGSGPAAVLGLVRDLRSQHESEEAILRSQEQLAQAQHIAHIGSWEWDLASGRVDWSDELYRIFRIEPGEVIVPEEVAPLVHVEDRAAVEATVADARARGGEYETDYRVVLGDGTVRWLHGRGEVVLDDNGDAVRMYGVAQDVTEQKENEARLREAELRYRTLVEQQPLAIYSRPLDMSKPNLYVSPQVESMLGYSVEEWETDPGLLARIIHPADRERVLADAANLRRTGEPIRSEYRYITKDGRTVWVLDETYLVHEDGEPCVQGYLLDISERKQAEDERDRARDDLLHAQKLDAIGQLAGGIAHDFNNTLTAIRGYADLLVDTFSQSHPLRRYVDEIRRAAVAGAALPRQLVAFGRREPLAVEALPINEVVSGSCRLFEPLLGEGIELVFEPGPELIVAGDRAQLGQALLNLALNARDAMPDGGQLTLTTQRRQLDVRTAEQRGVAPSDYAVISFADTGRGMDAATKSRVFEPFFTTKREGTGLGLAMLYATVQQCGGFVTLESEPDAGATFEIHLPCEDASVAPVPAPDLREDARTVLVAEDEPLVRGLVREVLELAGHQVVEAANGPEALAALERHGGEIDALVTDVKMPGMDGLELARRIRQDRPGGLPTVAISAHQVEATGDDILFLPKPFSAAELAETVDEALHWNGGAEQTAAGISVVVADDHPPVLDAVARVLETRGFCVVGTADDGPTALRQIVDRQPDVALVDIRMRRLSGVEVARRAAELAKKTAVVLYTGLGDRELLQQALDAGARGFLLKDTTLGEVAQALTRVAAGEIYVAPDLANALVSPETIAELPELTPREREVLELLAAGMTNDGAAAALSISPETIQTHVRKAMSKLDADTRTEAVATALRLALIA